MILNFPVPIARAMLDVLVAKLKGGGVIELTDSTGALLATLKLSTPGAFVDASGVMRFNAIRATTAVADGAAAIARVVDATGGAVFAADVGDEQSDSVIKFQSCELRRTGAVTLRDFELSLP